MARSIGNTDSHPVDGKNHSACATREIEMASPSDGDRGRVVVHVKGGKLLKGFTHDFRPGKSAFTLISEEKEDRGKTHEVRIADLKAIFFVRRLEGNVLYREKKKFKEVSATHLQGHRIELRFKDGEVIRGTTLDYSVGKQGFFVTPVDPMSNNQRIYVVADALRAVRFATDIM
jgi:hypothetical protein